MNTRKPKRPLYLLTAKRLRREHGISWYRVRRACDQGRLVPFAVNGDSQTDAVFFHPDQLDDLKAICANRPKRRWEGEESLQGKADRDGAK